MNQPLTGVRDILKLRPVLSKGEHPIETGKYLIPTNEIIRMFETVKRWIDNRTPGGMVYGRPRIGKTRAVNYLLHELPSEFGENLPVFVLRCREYKKPSENTFFEDILKDVQHGLPFSGKANIKRDRLFKFFLEKAERATQKRIILFIDDAQRLAEIQYGWLMDIYNELDSAGISMTAILVGQEELVHQRSAFIQSKKAQIIGRFMVHEHKFEGIKNIEDLSVCLSGYDNNSEYPVGSKWSFTRYFFPDAFDQGLRLENCADDLFNVMTCLRKEAGLSKTKDIPMQYITLTVEYALRRFGINGEDVDWLSKTQWRQAVINSGYIEAETYQEVV